MKNRDRDPDKKALDELSRAFEVDDENDELGESRASGLLRLIKTKPEPGTADPSPPITVDDEITADDKDEIELEPTAPTPIPERGESQPGVVVIEADEDLPDAAYVEGSLEGHSPKPVVIIEDDDPVDVYAPEVDRNSRRGIEPRMRDRRRAVRRAQGRKRLVLVGSIAGAVLAIVAVLAILGSGLFAVQRDNIEVFGVVYTDEQKLNTILDELAGTPALLVDETEIEAQIESIAWVEKATVAVDFPSTASIQIRERQALATFAGADGRFRVLDREGRVLDIIDGYPVAYVFLTSPDAVNLDVGEFAPRGFAAAAELVRSLTSTVRNRIEYIAVAADGSSLSMVLSDGVTVNLGAASDLLSKLVRLESLLIKYQDMTDIQLDVSTDETTRAADDVLARTTETVPDEGQG